MKSIRIFLVTLLSLLLLFPPNAIAEAIGTITYIEGRVDKLDKNGDQYLPVVIGDRVVEGDAVRTKSYSKAEVRFNDESIVRLGSTSQVKIREYEISEDGYRKKAVIDLERGRIRAIVSKTPDKTSFDINTPNASGSVKGSDVFISYQKAQTGILVADGMLRTLNPTFPDQAINIGKGSASFVPLNAPPEEPRIYLPIEKEQLESQTGPTIIKMKGISMIDEITTVMVKRVAGQVRIQPAGSGAWHAPMVNEILNTGDIIETGEDGRIEISMENGNILILKSNTQIILNILTQNPRTGEYVNSFECKYGKVIAKLKKIEGESSFKIKTPNAVCGMRGTIMYLQVLPALTKAFFEGGNGFLTSLISNITKIVEAGQTAWTDAEGSISDPTNTTDEDRQDFGSEWGDEQGDEYGYTPGEGGEGGDLAGAGLGGGAPDPEAVWEWLFNEVKPKASAAGVILPTGGAGLPAESPVFFGDLYGSFAVFDSEEEELVFDGLGSGLLAGVGNLWDGSTASVNYLGGYSLGDLDGEKPCIWHGSGWYIYSYNPFSGKFTTPDGGAFYGFASGTWADGIMDGISRAFFIAPGASPTWNTGYLSGDITGVYDSEVGIWGGTGDLTATLMGVTAMNPGDLFRLIETRLEGFSTQGAGIFGGGGELEGVSEGIFLNIYDQNWGLWSAAFGGTYEGPTSPFTFAIGSSLYSKYWLGVIKGDWDKGTLSGGFEGLFMRKNRDGEDSLRTGSMTGDVMGNYIEVEDGEGTWQAIGVGEWVELTELDPEILGFNLDDLSDFVEIPITEVYTDALSGTGSFAAGGSIAGNMNVSFFANDEGSFWTSLINGTYTGPTGSDWSLDLSGSDFDATLTGTQWSGNEWLATVAGSGPDGIEFTGEAGGTYTDVDPGTGTGTFEGVGAGTYETEAVE